MASGTLRMRIMVLLMRTGRSLTAREIAIEVGLGPKGERRVYSDLGHVAKSLKSRYGFALLMDPPRCSSCGYVFSTMRKPRKPNRCPKCKSERIEAPRFFARVT